MINKNSTQTITQPCLLSSFTVLGSTYFRVTLIFEYALIFEKIQCVHMLWPGRCILIAAVAPNSIKITFLIDIHTLIVTIFCLQGVKRSTLNRALIFLKTLHKIFLFSGNREMSKIRLIQSYEVLWIHVIDTIYRLISKCSDGKLSKNIPAKSRILISILISWMRSKPSIIYGQKHLYMRIWQESWWSKKIGSLSYWDTAKKYSN